MLLIDNDGYFLRKFGKKDFQLYQENYSKLTYSYIEGNGKPASEIEAKMRSSSAEEVWNRKKYQDVIRRHPEVELYYFCNKHGEVLGVTSLNFFPEHNAFSIGEFCVFQRQQGLGSKFLDMLLALILEQKPYVKRIEVQCPSILKGSRAFWIKKGFRPMLNNNDYLEKSL